MTKNFQTSVLLSVKQKTVFFLITIKILWAVTTQTQLFLTPPPKKSGAGEWPKLFRENNVELTRLCHVWWWCTPVFAQNGQKLANFPNGLLNDFRLPRRPLMVRAALL
jgi:hypothetical protein